MKLYLDFCFWNTSSCISRLGVHWGCGSRWIRSSRKDNPVFDWLNWIYMDHYFCRCDARHGCWYSLCLIQRSMVWYKIHGACRLFTKFPNYDKRKAPSPQDTESNKNIIFLLNPRLHSAVLVLFQKKTKPWAKWYGDISYKEQSLLDRVSCLNTPFPHASVPCCSSEVISLRTGFEQISVKCECGHLIRVYTVLRLPFMTVCSAHFWYGSLCL